jgi:hypothetical protein
MNIVGRIAELQEYAKNRTWVKHYLKALQHETDQEKRFQIVMDLSFALMRTETYFTYEFFTYLVAAYPFLSEEEVRKLQIAEAEKEKA